MPLQPHKELREITRTREEQLAYWQGYEAGVEAVHREVGKLLAEYRVFNKAMTEGERRR